VPEVRRLRQEDQSSRPACFARQDPVWKGKEGKTNGRGEEKYPFASKLIAFVLKKKKLSEDGKTSYTLGENVCKPHMQPMTRCRKGKDAQNPAV
jgi:hypothetical protein